MPLRVVIVDDHDVVRRGLRDLLETEEDLVVVGEAAGVEEALMLLRGTPADVAILDVQLTDGSGIELCRTARAEHPSLACIMLTGFDDDDALLASIVAGASGYVLKQAKGADIVAAVRGAGQGQMLLTSAVKARVIERKRHCTDAHPRHAELSIQEQCILDLLVEGRTNRQIGLEMHLTEKTVKNYMSNILIKLGLSSRMQAALYAARLSAPEHFEILRAPTPRMPTPQAGRAVPEAPARRAGWGTCVH